MKEVTINKIIEVINASEKVNTSENEINEPLTEHGMDSMTFIHIIVGLEEEFECEIPDSKLIMSELDTVKKMFDLLQILYKEEW